MTHSTGRGEPTGGESGMPRGYLRACLLLLVAEAPVHGYELMAQVDGLGLGRPDAGTVYRTLRALEDEGLVQSWWEPAAAGPARRVYRTTAAGRRRLDCATAALELSHRHLSAYLERHRSLVPGRAVPRRVACGW